MQVKKNSQLKNYQNLILHYKFSLDNKLKKNYQFFKFFTTF